MAGLLQGSASLNARADQSAYYILLESMSRLTRQAAQVTASGAIVPGLSPRTRGEAMALLPASAMSCPAHPYSVP